jgi:alpha-ketoglutarate-dependent taurine dioxygenase
LERQRIEVRPTGAAFGADIEGVDLARELAAATIDTIKQAWSDHLASGSTTTS